MYIEHVALWVNNIEKMKEFYVRYFQAKPNKIYCNDKGFSSYFLRFNNGCRLEIMSMKDFEYDENYIHRQGYIHLAISVGNKDNVVSLTNLLENDGYRIYSRPRVTGDGYFESVVLDPEGNQVEITV